MKKSTKKAISAMLAWSMTLPLAAMPKAEEAETTGALKPVIANEDFESYAEGTKLSETGLGWTVKDSTEGDKVTIEKDPVSNSKAVRIEQTKQTASKQSNPTTGFILDGFGDKITEGIVDISFKMRRETAGAQLPMNFLGIENQYKLRHYSGDMYFNTIQYDEKYWGGNSKDTYTTWNITYDFENDKLMINSTNGGKINISHDPVSYSGMQFLIAANYYEGAESWIGGEDGVNPVYWVDDIKVTRRSVEAKSTCETVCGAENAEIAFEFNCEIADECLTKEYFSLYQNGESLDDYIIAKDSENKNKVSITPKNGFVDGNIYKAVAKTGIKSRTDGIIESQSEYSFEIKIDKANVIADENFERFAEGTKLSETGLGWTVNDDKAGDKVTIEKDTVSNSKAVRIEQTKQTAAKQSNPTTGFILDGFGDKITEGIVDISFKIRREFGGAALPLGFLGIDNGYRWWQCNSAIYLGGWNNFGGNIKTEYTEWKITYDFANGKIKINNFTEEKNPGGYSGLKFLIAGNYGDGAESWLNGEENVNPVYWIDDISVTRRALAAESVTNVGREFLVDFNEEPKDEFVNGTYFKLYRGSEEINDLTVTKSAENPKRVIIKTTNAADYGVEYTVKVRKGIETVNAGYMPTVEEFSNKFVIKAQTTLVDENFNNSENLSSEHSDWEIKTGGGNVSVETDKATGNKALKIVNTKGNMENNGVIIPFAKQTAGKVKVSYKLRSENNNALLTGFSVNDSDGVKRVDVLQCKNTVYLYTNGLKWQDHALMTITDKYQKVDIIMDMDNNTYSVACDGIVKHKNINMTDGGGVEKLRLLISENERPWTGTTGAWVNDYEGDGIYWIDDISVVSYTYPEITSSSVANGAENVKLGATLTYTFDRDVTGVNKANVHIYKNGVLLTDSEYDIDYSNKTASITISEGLQYSTDYKVVFDDEIASEKGEKMKDSYIFAFKTEENPNAVLSAAVLNKNGVKVEDLSEYKGEKITVKAEINPNLTDYTFIAAIKDSEGKIAALQIAKSEDITDNTVSLEFTVLEEYNENYVVEGYIWKTSNQEPLGEKLELVKKNNNLKIYVSAAAPSGGCGTKEDPFNSLEEAKNYAREVKTQVSKTEIIVKDGEYKQLGAFSLGEQDNNTLIRAYGSSIPTISGGEDLDISKFFEADDSRIKEEVKSKIKKVNLKENGIGVPSFTLHGHSVNQLNGTSGGTDSIVCANGEMLMPARYPNDGYMKISSVKESDTGMKFTVDKDMSGWENAKDAWVFGYWYYDWSDQSAKVENIEENTITAKDASGFGVRAGQGFYIYNLLEELDSPGEWYYESETGDFYIYPPENCEKITICAVGGNLINISGAESIEIRGISIENVRGNGIGISGKYITVSGCNVKNTANCGISASGENIRITENTVANIGATGISVSGGNTKTLVPSNNYVGKNKVTDTARLITRYSPNLRMTGVGTKAEDNILSGNPHSAILFGGNDHDIINNEIYDVLYESADAGAIYAGRSSVSRGTEISGNYIHNLKTSSEAAHNIYGIYLDDCMSGITMKNNRLEDISGSGIFINGGRDNEVCANSFKNISKNGAELSTAGMTDWYGDDENFIKTLGLSAGIQKTVPYLKYPNLRNILEDDMRMPKYNVITGNSYDNCGGKAVIKIFDNITNEEMIRNINTISE